MKNQPKIRVLVVDDSVFLRRTIPRLLNMDPEIEVIGTASNGLEGLEMARKLRPDVITLDVIMPVMDGLTCLRHIMKQVPTAVIMISASTYDGARQTIEALSLGAVDYIQKPSGPTSLDIASIRNEMIHKIKALYTGKIKMAAGVNVASETFRNIISELSQLSNSPQKTNDVYHKKEKKELLAIAASTGGPAALQIVLGNLPENLPLRVVIVQHITKGFTRALAEKLDMISFLKVKVAKNNGLLNPGECVLAPSEYHLTIKKDRDNIYTVLNREPADTPHRPSADILFSSVAKVCGAAACAVIMTGMGSDGAKGIKEIKEKGGTTIAQNESTSIVFGMPKSAIETGGIDVISSLENISTEIIKTL